MTERQQRFVEAFLDRSSAGYLCATRAAAVAGYAWPGKQGPRLMTMPEVAEAVEREFKAACPVDQHGRWVGNGTT